MIFIWSFLLQLVLVEGTYIMQEPLRLRKAWFSAEDCGKDRTVVESLHNSCFSRMKLAVMGPKNADLELLRNISVYNETKASPRIYGGSDTENGQFPWTVRIASGNKPEDGWCTGSIIHERFVLTAAHCIHPHRGEGIFVYVGVDPPISEQMSEVIVQEKWLHPCYWENSTDLPKNYTGPEGCPDIVKESDEFFDIGLILLQNNLTNSNGRWPVHDSNQQNTYFKYNSVCLAEDGWPLDYNEVYQNSAWGYIKTSNFPYFGYPNHLQWIKYIIKNTSFNEHNINFHNRLGHMVCGGDSGSPIVVQNSDGRYYQRSVMFSYDDQAEIPGIGSVRCGKSFAKSVDIYYTEIKNWIWETIRNATRRDSKL